MLFKIRTVNGSTCTAFYLDEAKLFSFNNQTSMPNLEFTLYKGTQINMEFDAIGKAPEPGKVVDCEGSFYNFTKKNPPELVFCVTGINVAV